MNGDNERQGPQPVSTARDVENQVIQEVLNMLTNTQLLEEVDAAIAAAAAGGHIADSSLTNESTLEDWRKRERQLQEKVAALEATVQGGTSSGVSELTKKLRDENDEMRSVLAKMAVLLKDKTGMCATQESKVSAMSSQITSLKEVVAITKDLLNIRNLEVNHLSQDIQSMQTKIEDEQTRHNQLMVKMEKMVTLNGALKEEYQIQLKIFQELRDKYEAKMKLADEKLNPPSA